MNLHTVRAARLAITTGRPQKKRKGPEGPFPMTTGSLSYGMTLVVAVAVSSSGSSSAMVAVQVMSPDAVGV